MCLLTYYPEGVMPDADALRCGATCNDNGHGWAILIPGQPEIKVYKSMDSDRAIDEFVRFRAKFPAGPAMFHSRLTTHGETSRDNCHPFRVNGDPRTVLGHNGILPARSPHKTAVQPLGYYVDHEEILSNGHLWKGRRWIPTDNRSDTRIFAEDVVKREFAHLDSEKTQRRLTAWLGTGNKILILTTDPRYAKNAYLFNEGLGEWDDQTGIWYSNSSYLSFRSRHVYSSRDWDDAWSDYDLTASGSGIWARGGSEGWSGDAEDPESWPVTLGGTREPVQVISLVSCDVCGMADCVIADSGLCIECHNCNDCYSYIRECECSGRAYPETYTYGQLREALNFSGDPAVILNKHREYRTLQKRWARLDIPSSGGEWGAWKGRAVSVTNGTVAVEPKAIAATSEPTPETIDGEVIADAVADVAVRISGADGQITLPL